MDWLQFISSIVQSIVSLAWPAAFVTAVWLFREKLTSLLPLLRFKYKDLDVSFRLDQAEKEASQLKLLPPNEESRPTPEEADKFQELVTISPASAIIERYRELEDALKGFASTVGLPAEDMRQTMLGLTRQLRRHELIDQATSALLDDLRSVRNAAAHGQRDEITARDAIRFGELAGRLIAQINLATDAAAIKVTHNLPTH